MGKKKKKTTQCFLNVGPNESRIVPKFQPVFVAWASTFEEHNSLPTALEHFPNFSY
jgi:hypothetical protein